MKKVSFLVLILFIVSLLSAQSVNFNLTGAGARAAGMGGAFIGVADDATAVVWNPAGLTQLYKPEASVVTRFINDRNKWEYPTEDYTESQQHFVLNFVSGASPLTIAKRRIVLAAAYQKQIDLYGFSSSDNYEYEGKGGVNSLTFGAASEIMPFLSVGLAANIWFGTFKSNEIVDDPPYYFEDQYEESYSGFNLNLGVMMNLNNLNNPLPLRIGFNFKTPFDLEGEYEGTEIETGYYDWEYEGDFTFKMPVMLGIGLSYRLGEYLTLAADYETQNYKTNESFDFNLNKVRFGGEYLLVSDFIILPIRVGWQTYPTLYEDNAGQVVGMGWSIGSGLIFERFSLDFTFLQQGYNAEYDSYDFGSLKSTISASCIFYF